MTGDSSLHTRDVERDVRELGSMLGEVLEAQTSRSAFELVESVRTDAIGYRRGDVDSRAGVRRTLSDLGEEESSVVARAFTTYFELVNVAEERERVRAVREREAAGALGDSIPAAVDRLAEAGVDAGTVESILGDILVEPTFTAHPTEARRKTVKAKLRSVRRGLDELDTRRLSAAEERGVERRLAAEVTSLWQTPQVRDRRPEPIDEALNVRWYLEKPSSTSSATSTTGSNGRSTSDTTSPSRCRSCSSSGPGPGRTVTATPTSPPRRRPRRSNASARSSSTATGRPSGGSRGCSARTTGGSRPARRSGSASMHTANDSPASSRERRNAIRTSPTVSC